jgi:hypothetical protein
MREKRLFFLILFFGKALQKSKQAGEFPVGHLTKKMPRHLFGVHLSDVGCDTGPHGCGKIVFTPVIS